MPKLSDPRQGKEVVTNGRNIDFGFWPMEKKTRFKSQFRIFATNPWLIIKNSIAKRCPLSSRGQAFAFLVQAEEYFNAANLAGVTAVKPVLYYYSFLNIAKCYVLTVYKRASYEAAYHGLENPKVVLSNFVDTEIHAHISSGQKVNIYEDFYGALTSRSLSKGQIYPLKYIFPQLLQGHRIWAGINAVQERFIEVSDLNFFENRDRKEAWLGLEFSSRDLRRLYVSNENLLKKSLLVKDYRNVKSNDDQKIIFEQITPYEYVQRAADIISSIVDSIKPKLWVNVLSIPPYRKYYIYLAPATEHGYLVNQLLSIYLTFFYLGSVTRYKPELYDKIMKGEFSPFVGEIITNLPKQFIYLMASEFAQQEVTRAAII